MFRSTYTIFVGSRKWSVLDIEHCKPYWLIWIFPNFCRKSQFSH
jgi:hypothetical protein